MNDDITFGAATFCNMAIIAGDLNSDHPPQIFTLVSGTTVKGTYIHELVTILFSYGLINEIKVVLRHF